jgi:hypothetical protein
MLGKKLRIRRKQAGIQDLQNTRKINLRVFRVRMIAMNQKREGGQQQQAEDAAEGTIEDTTEDTFDIQSVPVHFSENYSRKYLRQEAGAANLWPADPLPAQRPALAGRSGKEKGRAIEPGASY